MRISREFYITGRKWAAIGLAAFALGSCRSDASRRSATDDDRPHQSAIAASATARPSNRLVFPWSVVSGGVDSPLAMRAAMREDPVVESHYAGLNSASFRAEILHTKRQGYVSYRIRDEIYWTRRMVTLQAGEVILNNGRFQIRGRCGNLISETPREPTAPAAMEPEEPAMDRPVPEAQLMYSPPLPAYPIPETESLPNPKQSGTGQEMTTVLPRPDSQEVLPPIWTAGGGSTGLVGVIGTPGGGGTAETPAVTPVPPELAVPEIPVPGEPSVPVEIHTPPIEIAPPLIIASAPPPSGATTNPASPILPGYIWPGDGWGHPPMPNYPPDSTTSPPYPQPVVPPPSLPPPGTPPRPDLLPSDPPRKDPPALDPPFPPPGPTTEDLPIPEPGPWILFALGLAAIVAGALRKKD
jgi:hypothetical protein